MSAPRHSVHCMDDGLASWGRFPHAPSLDTAHRTNKLYSSPIHYREKRAGVDRGSVHGTSNTRGGPTVDWAERHVLRTLPPLGPRSDPSFFPLRSLPCLHAQPNLVEATLLLSRLVLLPLHHQHSTALHSTGAAPSRSTFPTYDAASP